jgi:hypothetical protein
MKEAQQLAFAPPYEEVYATFDNRINKMRIHRRTLRLMGDPQFIRLHYHKMKLRMILERIEPEDAGNCWSIKSGIFAVPQRVYEKGRPFELTGQPFFEILRGFTEWKPFANYQIKGECSVPSQNVILYLDDYAIILQGKELKLIVGKRSIIRCLSYRTVSA